MLIKSIFRTIRKSLGRYLAILAIIALGVGFFAGLRVTETAMLQTADDYINELKLFDFRLISTLGLTEEDVQAFASLDGVQSAEGSVSADFIYLTKDGSDAVFHAHTLTSNINQPDLLDGRLPQSSDECIIDARFKDSYEIGSKLVFSDNNSEETTDIFAHREYTVVGHCNAVTYINYERGTTSLAGGEASGYVYLLPEAFCAEYYTEMYLTLRERGEIYSEEYQSATDGMRGKIEAVLNEQADERYQNIRTDAETKLRDAETKLNSKKQELADGQAEVEDGWRTYRSKRAETEEKLNATKQQLDNTRAELDAGWASAALMASGSPQRSAVEFKLNEGEKEYTAGLTAYQNAAAQARSEFAKTEKRLKEAQSKLEDAVPAIEDAENELNQARDELSKLTPPTVYALDRSSNPGYVALENDTAIVSGVAKVFPLFFFLVAALVCVTTMTRMVSVGRTENGVLKALGYGTPAIAGQYLFYAGSASVLGCIIGFLLGSKLLPMALWQVYHILYSIDRPIAFVLDWKLFLICTALYLLGVLGVTWLTCYKDLRENTAALIRPKAPMAGKRILLERIGFIWNRMKFLHKVSVRNILRYKKRMYMMVLGIGGCTALLITGFGIRDTIQPVLKYQYEEITLYDASVSFLEDADSEQQSAFLKQTEEVTDDVAFLHTESVDVPTKNGERDIHLIMFEEALGNFIDLHDGKQPIFWPQTGEAVVNYRFAAENGIASGDALKLRMEDGKELSVTVSGIFDNYLYDYIYISADTCQILGDLPKCNTAYVNFSEGQDAHAAGAVLLNADNVASATVNADMATRMGNMLDSLDYIVLIVLVCAGALAFIVLYNLTNISITERAREIATLKVLGFYAGEQNSYVFRENLALTGISALCGIPMGIALLRYVMDQIKIGSFYFGCRLAPESYLWAILITFAFTIIVDLALTVKIKHIDMAEAMKAIE